MSALKESRELTVNLEDNDKDTLVVHPREAEKIDCEDSPQTFNLYTDMDEFIHASDDFREVTLDQNEDAHKGVIVIHSSLNDEMGKPASVVLFRKNKNIFLKPRS